MTLQEASSCFHLDVKMLRLYEESGLIRTEKTESGETDYPEAELRKAAQLCALQRAGMELEELKKLCDLQRSGCCEAKIRLLRKCRCRLLEQIHQKQQALGGSSRSAPQSRP